MSVLLTVLTGCPAGIVNGCWPYVFIVGTVVVAWLQHRPIVLSSARNLVLYQAGGGG